MKPFSIALLVTLLLTLFMPMGACQAFKKKPEAVPTVKVGQTTTLSTASTKADDASKTVETKYDIRDSKLMANIQAAQGQMPNFPDGRG